MINDKLTPEKIRYCFILSLDISLAAPTRHRNKLSTQKLKHTGK
ncbi:hypothetical protein SALWKB12_0331 [Snodgrassella communis]|uniref:Uncharacterized protein n=1 Tax=Snodgrassella communis TaxID=2946699 RepID=A0A836Z4X8_9NEIS|nr:hypothetical protein SALWKB12_0331 [Snodgrassella communis]KDN15773.1 hypothetical protein SALWKB29_0192 [Snodgrassella communis]